VFPNAFIYEWEQVVSRTGAKKEEYDLIIRPNVNYEGEEVN